MVLNSLYFIIFQFMESENLPKTTKLGKMTFFNANFVTFKGLCQHDPGLGPETSQLSWTPISHF